MEATGGCADGFDLSNRRKKRGIGRRALRIQGPKLFERGAVWREVVRPVRSFKQAGDQLAEVEQGRFWIGGEGQQVGEMFYQHDCRPHFSLLFGIGDLCSAVIGYI